MISQHSDHVASLETDFHKWITNVYNLMCYAYTVKCVKKISVWYLIGGTVKCTSPVVNTCSLETLLASCRKTQMNLQLQLILDPRAVAVSCYGWLKTSYGWLAAAYAYG